MTVSTLRGHSQTAEARIQALRQRAHQLVDTVHTLQHRCDELGHQDAAWRNQQQALHEQLAGLTEERDQLKSERDALAASQQALDSERDSLQADCNALREQRDALQTERDGLQWEREDLSSRLLTLTSEIQQLASQRQELSGQLDTLSSQHSALQQEQELLSAELEALKTNHGLLLAERDQLTSKCKDITNQLGELRIHCEQRDNDWRHLTSSKVIDQIIELENPEACRQKRKPCRNCGSPRTIKLEGAGRVAPFFAQRVLGATTQNPFNIRLDGCLCLDCLFLSHLVELPEENISRLYIDYRSATYNAERIALEPEYEAIAPLVGQDDEIKSRNQALDHYFLEIQEDARLLAAPSSQARALDWGGGDGRYIPSFITKTFDKIDIYDISSNRAFQDAVDPGVNSGSPSNIRYAYIQFCHVLEHVQRPLETVRHAAENYLDDSGLMYIEVPVEEDMETFAGELLAHKDAGYVIHEHINKYCLRSLALLIKATGQLEIINIKRDTVDIGWTPQGKGDNASMDIIRCLCVKSPSSKGRARQGGVL